ncbi:Type 1 glutamine amidotransferase-like domain-containing protein, partial [Poseidonibacter lekithochrous]|uniref:Type 1 glutamine amidotransferase-like domain-containing protein n=1 Tax=Poseidonibacter lekithochrous TaxID=1904463 RepID=UPI000ABA0DBF
AVIRSSLDDRVAAVQDSINSFGPDCEVMGLQQAQDPVKAIEEADGILVSGGNTWVLNKTLHDLKLEGHLRKEVLLDGKPNISWFSLTNICCPIILTTNDMP